MFDLPSLEGIEEVVIGGTRGRSTIYADRAADAGATSSDA
jgi:hypothetical protein